MPNTIRLRRGSTTPSAGSFAEGEPAWDSTNSKLYVKNAAAAMVQMGTHAGRSITIASPATDDTFTVFRTMVDIKITEIVGLVSGGSVAYELRYATDRTAAGTLIASGTVTNTTTGASQTVSVSSVASGNYVWVKLTAVSGSPAEFNLSLNF
jgi:hypothetical protein